ncbi:MAG: class I SAM-dependent methyltransferase, partial [Nocardioides sp.]|nr:class I SAM-dependent methyltransferase [Nocardioides sp.]
MARAELDKQPTDVRRMFDAVARRYDVTNDVLSLGQDRRWRRDVIEAVDPQYGELVLD